MVHLKKKLDVLGIFLTMTFKIRILVLGGGGGIPNANNNVPLLQTGEESGRSLTCVVCIALLTLH